MEIFQHKKTIQNYLKPHLKKRIGFVPTMGALHEGHLSLVAKSIAENDVTVVSIFVNPTQFNNSDDLKKYPKTLKRDIALLASVTHNLILFNPSVEEMYKENVSSQKFKFNGLEFEMEGKHRPGHFDGVGTIVKSFLNIIQPSNAYFGEKDYQQFLIVKTMASNHKIPVNIIGCPIKREPHGLAMSSRNERLSKNTRQRAAIIYETLKIAKEMFGTKSAIKVSKWVEKQFESDQDFKLEYFEIANADTLKTTKRKIKNTKYRAFIAVYANDIRLIDNIALN